MAKKLLCKLFGHRFGGGEYKSANNCVRVRTCKRCGTQKEYEDHIWVKTAEKRPAPTGVPGDTDLWYTTTCKRCGEFKESGWY